MAVKLIYHLFAKLLSWMVLHARSDTVNEIEILVLRHQLAVLQREIIDADTGRSVQREPARITVSRDGYDELILPAEKAEELGIAITWATVLSRQDGRWGPERNCHTHCAQLGSCSAEMAAAWRPGRDVDDPRHRFGGPVWDHALVCPPCRRRRRLWPMVACRVSMPGSAGGGSASTAGISIMPASAAATAASTVG